MDKNDKNIGSRSVWIWDAVFVLFLILLLAIWLKSYKTAFVFRYKPAPGVRGIKFSSEFSCLRFSRFFWELPSYASVKTDWRQHLPRFYVRDVDDAKSMGPFVFESPGAFGRFSTASKQVPISIPGWSPESAQRRVDEMKMRGITVATPAQFYYIDPHICVPIWVIILAAVLVYALLRLVLLRVRSSN